MRNFTEFIQVMNFPETPLFPIAITLGVLCIWIVKAGIETIGRWAAFMLPLVIISIIVVSLLLIPRLDLNNIRPVLYNGFNPVLNGAAAAFAFPFAETFLFTIVFNSLRDKNKVLKVYLWGLIISGCVFIMTSMRNIMVLGEKLNLVLYFPSYLVEGVVNIKEFIDRIEVFVGGNFVFLGFVKISICLYAACIGTAKIFSLKDYRQIVAPIGLMMAIISVFIYKSTMEMVQWAAENYLYYIIPFSVILPLATWIAAEFKLRSGKHSNKNN
jgi:spore germination protein KB